MSFKEVVEKIKEKFTKEKLIGYWQWLWGKEPEPVDESVLEDPDRYVKLDDENDDKYWKDVARYKGQKSDLRMRRIVICVFIVFLVYQIFQTVKNYRIVSCIGKDACIVRGPVMNNPDFGITLKNMDNGKILISYRKSVNYFYRKYLRPIIYPQFNYLGVKTKLDKKMEKNGSVALEIFSPQRQQLKELNNNGYIGYPIFANGEYIVFYDSKANCITKYDLKIRQNILKKCNLSADEIKKIQDIGTLGIQYDNDNILSLTNNNNIFITLRDSGWCNIFLKKKENMYLYNFATLTYKEMPDFEKRLKYYPISRDIKVLKNGKIIVPIRNIKNGKSIWDHIEIYDPIHKKFIAEFNTEALDNNYFEIERENGDVVYINKDSTYIFQNATNSFVKADNYETEKNKIAIEKIQKMLNGYIGIDFTQTEPKDSAIRITKIGTDKFLLTCGYRYFSSPYKKSFNDCRKTILYNYKNNSVKHGPDFLYPHAFIKEAQIDEKSVFFAGGDDGCLGLVDMTCVPNKYTQILYVKD